MRNKLLEDEIARLEKIIEQQQKIIDNVRLAAAGVISVQRVIEQIDALENQHR